jgi:hypothetical protein
VGLVSAISPTFYHHARDFEHVRHDIVLPWRVTQALPPPDCLRGCEDTNDEWHDALHFEACYRWLAQRVGFWPLWLAVGADDEDRRMSGYHTQFRKRAPGEERSNSVLFSWTQPPSAALRYLCYEHWYIVLNSVYYEGDCGCVDGAHPQAAWVSAQIEEWVMHPRRQPRAWLRAAAREPHSVQAVAPMLDLRSADSVWCRNQSVARDLIRMGFARERVRVQRMSAW